MAGGTNRLTNTKIKALNQAFIGDGNNLFLKARGDSKRFIFRYLAKPWQPKAGSPIEISLGSYPALSLKAARVIASDMLSALAEKRDPRFVVKPEEEEQPVFKTFGEYVSELIASKEAGWRSAKHGAQWNTTVTEFAKSLLPIRPGDITIEDILKILKPMWASKAKGGKVETASRLRGRIEAVLDYAFIQEGIDKRNPASWRGNLKTILAEPRKVAGEKQHLAAPPYEKVPSIMAELRKVDTTPALALRYAILTAARSSEVRLATFSEVDIKAATHTIPGPRMKGGREHIVPLNAEAVAIIEIMIARKLTDNELIFTNRKGDAVVPVSINRTLAAIYPDITAHGLARSCFADWAAELTSFPNAVVEAALAHKDINATRAAYLRTSHFDKRLQLMKSWGDYCAGISNVVQISPKSEAA